MEKAQRVGRNAQVLKYLTTRSRRIGATRLLKLTYLADITARKFLGRQISELEYIWYDYGPFDRSFYDARDELILAGVAQEQHTSYPEADYEKRTLVDLDEPVQYDFDEIEVQILDYVFNKYGGLPLKGLLDKAYETEPMERVKEEGQEGDRLPMEMVDGKGRRELEFDLEDLAAAQERIRSGRYVTLGDFERELRAKIGRGGSG